MSATERSARKREADRLAAEAHSAAIMAQADTLLEAARELTRLGSPDVAKRCQEAAEAAVMLSQRLPMPKPVTEPAPEPIAAGMSFVKGEDLNGYDPRQAAFSARMKERTDAAVARDALRKAQYG
jgi:hypothetical protein